MVLSSIEFYYLRSRLGFFLSLIRPYLFMSEICCAVNIEGSIPRLYANSYTQSVRPSPVFSGSFDVFLFIMISVVGAFFIVLMRRVLSRIRPPPLNECLLQLLFYSLSFSSIESPSESVNLDELECCSESSFFASFTIPSNSFFDYLKLLPEVYIRLKFFFLMSDYFRLTDTLEAVLVP